MRLLKYIDLYLQDSWYIHHPLSICPPCCQYTHPLSIHPPPVNTPTSCWHLHWYAHPVVDTPALCWHPLCCWYPVDMPTSCQHLLCCWHTHSAVDTPTLLLIYPLCCWHAHLLLIHLPCCWYAHLLMICLPPVDMPACCWYTHPVVDTTASCQYTLVDTPTPIDISALVSLLWAMVLQMTWQGV